MRKAGASGSTLLKGTSTSDSRQASSRAQRALQDKRTNITAADLDRKPMGTKRSRENDVPAEVRGYFLFAQRGWGEGRGAPVFRRSAPPRASFLHSRTTHSFS